MRQRNPPLLMDYSPTDFSRVVIVGAGGFGREVLQWVNDAWPEHRHLVCGFLSSDGSILANKACDLPILGDPATFALKAGDAFLLAIGIPLVRRQVAEILLTRGARFLTLIHPTAIVSSTASIGTGSILCPYSVVTDSACLGQFTVLNFHASIAHDASTGEFSVLSPYAALGGSARIGDDVFLGMHATVGPQCTVGAGSKVTANSCALCDAPAGTLVHGVPGRNTPLVSLSHPAS